LPRKDDSKRTERLELARRLHDGPAQELIALGYKLDEVIGAPDLPPLHRKAIRDARLDLISLTRNLRDELYLLERITLDEAVIEVRAILEKIEVIAEIDGRDINAHIENVLAKILLEIARNCARHAKANKFWVINSRDEGKDIFKIGNDGGKGISIKSRSLGLKLIAEQANQVGAVIELKTDKKVFEYTIALNSSAN